jgi:hypothetical protein
MCRIFSLELPRRVTVKFSKGTTVKGLFVYALSECQLSAQIKDSSQTVHSLAAKLFVRTLILRFRCMNN